MYLVQLFRRRGRRVPWLLGAAAALTSLLIGPAWGQNVSIDSWTLPGNVRSADVRILSPATVAADLFIQPEAISLIKSNNAIYARFHNNGLAIIPDGGVTVTAEYAEAEPGLAPGVLAATVAALPGAAWHPLGTYVMDLEILVSDPPGYGLLPGASYPTVREVGIPGRYRLVCTIGCQQPLPTSFFLRVTLNLPGDSDPSDNVALAYYDLTGGVPPADVVLLHDLSGSMVADLPLVKERAKFFLDLLNAGDRTGIVAFSTQFAGDTHVYLGLNTITTIHPSDPTKTTAKNHIDTFMANGLTPMGSGVLAAQGVLNAGVGPFPDHRAIVMLTDGRENRDPRLKDPPGYPILDGLNTDANGGIALYPLWFGAVSHWGKSLLEDIVLHVDEGKLVDQPEDDLELAEAYLMIRGILLADDIFAIHRGTTGDGYEGLVHVDNVSREFLLTAAWRTFRRELSIEVMPPGSSTWQPAEAVAGSTSRGDVHVVHRIQNPQTGPWRYRLRETGAGEPYVLSALADQVEVLFQTKLARAAVPAGQPLEIQARLSRAGRPVSGAQVRATVQVPDAGLGTMLWKYRDRLDAPDVLPGGEKTRAVALADQLRKVTGRDRIFRYEPHQLTLTDPDGDGTYTARFTDTRVAGTYRITLHAEGGKSGYEFNRQHELAAVVSVGRIDPRQSKVDVALVDRIGRTGARVWRTTVTPVDVHGNVLDPGYADRIRIEARNGRWLEPLEDNQDGSYSRLIEVEPQQQPELSISVSREKLPVRPQDFRDLLHGKGKLDPKLEPKRDPKLDPKLDPKRQQPPVLKKPDSRNPSQIRPDGRNNGGPRGPQEQGR